VGFGILGLGEGLFDAPIRAGLAGRGDVFDALGALAASGPVAPGAPLALISRYLAIPYAEDICESLLTHRLPRTPIIIISRDVECL